ncbi:hypothetical protein Cni_G03268 [Canna indica]|uniref:NAD-dependent epimerase/dehydratase domain-containing protein n=1 Tax=Canna indica TaxID=4628 RepID=A0AAQ3JQS6_9LILI|nr:hypothetical protein Cni_G03268 [Canna indica]
METNSSPHVVAVTGAGGYIASWLVKALLSRGYHVRGTEKVRDAVEGTKNVIRTAASAGVRRVVFTSSIGAVHMNPKRSPDAVLDESCWSDPEFCKNTKNWYCYAKMMAEKAAMEEAEKVGVELVVVVPSLTMGPFLHATISGSIAGVLGYMTGSIKAYRNAVQGYVDVRDIVQAHILVYENSAASGRYLCIEKVIHRSELCQMLRDMFPDYPVTDKCVCSDEVNPRVKPYKFSNKRIRDLGLELTPIKQSLYETVKCLQERGDLPPPRARLVASL